MSKRSRTPSSRATQEPPYVTSPSRVPNQEGTPSKRPKYASSVSSSVRARAQSDILRSLDIDFPNANVVVCVVSRANQKMDEVEYSYVAKQPTPAETLDKLEWAWDMEYHTLNLETRKNIQTLSVVLHRQFDRVDGWFWVPADLQIIASMYKNYVRQKKARYDPQKIYDGKTRFRYKLVASPSMRDFWAMRRYNGSYNSLDADLICQYQYPFDELPEITMAVHPHFAILDTGRKLVAAFGTAEHPSFSQIYEINSILAGYMQYVLEIYRHWMASNPPDSFLHSKDQVPVGDQPPTSRSDTGGSRSRTRSKKSATSAQREGSGDVGGGVGGAMGATNMDVPNDSISRASLYWEDQTDDGEAGEDDEYQDGDYDEKDLFRQIQDWAATVAAADSVQDESNPSSCSSSSTLFSSKGLDQEYKLLESGTGREGFKHHSISKSAPPSQGLVPTADVIV